MATRELELIYSDYPLENEVLNQILILEGLGCANCAAKIEREVQHVPGVQRASLDFISRKLALEIEASISMPGIIEKIESIVKRIEPDVKVVQKSSENQAETISQQDNHFKLQTIKLIIGGALFAVALILDLAPELELALFLLSYVIVGGSVVVRALRGIARGQIFSEHFLMSVATIGAFLIGEYPEGVGVMLFYLVGEMFQDSAVDQSRQSISSLMEKRPD